MSAIWAMLISALLGIWTFIGIVIVFWAVSEYLKKGKGFETALNVGLFYFVLTMILIGVLAA